MRRASGVLVHPTSLPGRYGIGDLGSSADELLDWLFDARQRYWQVLPLGPTGMGNSPYSALSSFAGNPLLISPERLVEEGLLRGADLEDAPSFPDVRVDYPAVDRWKRGLLREAWRNLESGGSEQWTRDLQGFVGAPEQAAWLEDWSLYAALKADLGGAAWYEWPRELRLRERVAMDAARVRLGGEVAYQRFLQFLFARQWSALKGRANGLGILIFGDVPIYTALDSAEVWSRPELFELDESGRPLKVAGVPPDYFSETGQLWGNPIYRWDRMRDDGYLWWIERLRANLRLVDLLRLDHFLGFAAYWEVDGKETTAIDGRWVEGPGIGFFRAVERALGEVPLVAEDLGVITDEVRQLREDLGFPGMKVLQFGFGEIDSEHLPHNVTPDTVYYTGTHDNDTVVGWFGEIGPADRARALEYLGGDGSPIHQHMTRAVATSAAGLAMIPIQDVLGLDSSARLNTPGVASGNWEWRLAAGQLSRTAADRLARLTELSGRLPETSG